MFKYYYSAVIFNFFEAATSSYRGGGLSMTKNCITGLIQSAFKGLSSSVKQLISKPTITHIVKPIAAYQ